MNLKLNLKFETDNNLKIRDNCIGSTNGWGSAISARRRRKNTNEFRYCHSKPPRALLRLFKNSIEFRNDNQK